LDELGKRRKSMFSLEEKDQNPSAIGRRAFVAGSIAVGALLAWLFSERKHPVDVEAAVAAAADLPKTVKIVEFDDNGKKKSTITVDRISKTDEEWKKLLSPDSFIVARRAGTERPYTNENPNDHAKGVFRCICCDTALFNADTKCESGTGWPSFWAPIAKENVLETTDSSLGMVRTAVSCRLCDAHLGHVFDDGPRPTGLRYCMNSVAMRFAKAA
jgi:peptide-methionine (R)-S-oxide reductase